MALKESFGLLGLLLFISVRGHAQTDSVHVYLRTTGLNDTDLQVEYQGKPLLYSPVGGGVLLTATIPVDPKWEWFTRLPFRMTTARAQGVRRKDVTIPVAFHPPYRYLVILQDAEVKRKGRIRWYWTDSAPQKII